MSLKGAGSIARLYMSPKLILTSLWLTGAKGFFLRKKKPYCDTGGNYSFKGHRTQPVAGHGYQLKIGNRSSSMTRGKYVSSPAKFGQDFQGFLGKHKKN